MKIDLREIPIIYLNMEHDVRRREHLEFMLNDLVNTCGFKKENIYRVETALSPVKENGVSQAHLDGLAFADQFDGPFIILEDDVFPTAVMPVVEIPDNTDAIYLANNSGGVSFAGPWTIADQDNYNDNGITVNVNPIEDNPNLFKVNGMIGACAILYVTKHFKKAVEGACRVAIKDLRPHDAYIATFQRFFNIYAFNQPMFINLSGFWDTAFCLERSWYSKGLNHKYWRSLNLPL